jgi:hypothetical protein
MRQPANTLSLSLHVSFSSVVHLMHYSTVTGSGLRVRPFRNLVAFYSLQQRPSNLLIRLNVLKWRCNICTQACVMHACAVSGVQPRPIYMCCDSDGIRCPIICLAEFPVIVIPTAAGTLSQRVWRGYKSIARSKPFNSGGRLSNGPPWKRFVSTGGTPLPG